MRTKEMPCLVFLEVGLVEDALRVHGHQALVNPQLRLTWVWQGLVYRLARHKQLRPITHQLRRQQPAIGREKDKP